MKIKKNKHIKYISTEKIIYTKIIHKTEQKYRLYFYRLIRLNKDIEPPIKKLLLVLL